MYVQKIFPMKLCVLKHDLEKFWKLKWENFLIWLWKTSVYLVIEELPSKMVSIYTFRLTFPQINLQTFKHDLFQLEK